MMKSIRMGLALLLLATVGAGSALAAQTPQTPIAGKTIPQFVQALPLLSISGRLPDNTMATVFGNQPLTIRMCEFNAQVLPPPMPVTRVWGYIAGEGACPTAVRDTYIGPVIVNNRGTSTDITWVNDLGTTALTGVLAYKYSTDQTLHWADPKGTDPDGGDSWGPENNLCAMMGLAPGFDTPCAANYDGPIPAVVHLHGGEVPPELDGGPDAWFTSDGLYQGHGYYSFPAAPPNAATYKYPNKQEAAPIWFHDHTLGATRLGVYAGLAGAYYIQDAGLNLPANLQPLAKVVPVVLQDRTFDANGQLFMPADSAGGILWSPNPEHPYWVPEFVGDTIVVNGKAWPFLNVEPRRYRFLFLNGSNARTYEMSLINQATGANGPPMYVIATDGGYLDAPVKLDPALGQKLLMQPGERYEVIIDFTGFAGTNLIIRNTGRTPFPKGAPPQGSTLGRILQFRVGAIPVPAVPDLSYNPALGIPLRTGSQMITRLINVTPNKIRQLTLNEVMGMPVTTTDPVTGVTTAYPGGPLEILVNNTKWSGDSARSYDDFTTISVTGGKPSHQVTTKYSEIPQEGTTEVWEIVNLTADAHPIHLHLVQFQIMNRQNYNVSKYTKAYATAFPVSSGCAAGVFCPGFGPPLIYDGGNPRALGGNPDIVPFLQGAAAPPLPQEAGWKDTAIMYPGQVTRIAVRWAPTDLATTAPAIDLHFPFDPYDGAQHGYVWHCHIIDHEDNEMMRPTAVTLNPAALLPKDRSLVKGTDY